RSISAPESGPLPCDGRLQRSFRRSPRKKPAYEMPAHMVDRWVVRSGNMFRLPGQDAIECAAQIQTASAIYTVLSGAQEHGHYVLLSNGISAAHLVSRYSSSGAVRMPCNQAAAGRKVRGPSLWQRPRSHLGFDTSTVPKTILIVCVPAPLL